MFETFSFLANPDLFYVLLIAGFLGIALEFLHPASFIPGILGLLCLFLAVVGGAMLPLSTNAVIILIVSLFFMVAEIFIPAFGILGIGGFVGFVFASFMLIERNNAMGLSISSYTIIPVVLLVALAFLGVGYLLIKSQRSRIKTGEEALLGDVAIAVEDFKGSEGMVRMDGEFWSAELVDPSFVKQGDKLIVKARDGLKLKVQIVRT
jgi:membrane-bound serine protease (ClpP class)